LCAHAVLVRCTAFDFVTENLLRYMPAKSYQNRSWFDKVIAKIKLCGFFTHMVVSKSLISDSS